MEAWIRQFLWNAKSVRSRSGLSVALRDDRCLRPSREIRRSAPLVAPLP
jgi:hypothetical protein